MAIDADELRRQERFYWRAFAASLAEYAEAHGMSAAEMADLLGVDAGTYSRTVNGRERQPRIGRAARFARRLGLSLDEMVRLKEEDVELGELGKPPPEDDQSSRRRNASG